MDQQSLSESTNEMKEAKEKPTQDLIELWSQMVLFDPIDVFTFDEDGIMFLRNLATMPSDARRMIHKTQVYRDGSVKIRFVNRLTASQKLGKVQGVFNPSRESEPKGLIPALLAKLRTSGKKEVDEFLDLLESNESVALMAKVPARYWDGRENGSPLQESATDGSPCKVDLSTFWHATIQFDPLDFFVREGGSLLIRDLRTMAPDVRRQISEIRVSKRCMNVKHINKMRACDLLWRTLQMDDLNDEEAKCDSDIISVIRQHLPTATYAEAAEFHELLESSEFLTTGQISAPRL